VPEIRCRPIGEADVAGVARLLSRGFPKRGPQFWFHALHRLAAHQPPAGLPKYGYLMESDGALVGAILLIFSAVRTAGGDALTIRCNLSSWCVDPAYRAYAALLVAHAIRHRNVTYLNVSPAPHTRPIIEAQGFSRYRDGIFIAFPILNGWIGGPKAEILAAHEVSPARLDRRAHDILLQHARHGCLSLWCQTRDRAYPFVFVPRLAKGFIPCAQLIYSEDIADFARFAGPIGRYLARLGRPVVVVDANGPIPGLAGLFCRIMPKYFKGPQCPRLGDLAFTESAMMGI
jgi:hypothetical protein